ncbi:TetR/AcrR family transcriptional regulator [Microlunatus endophyticus]|nr:TetR/AcrR family transcriptional regulator [Microlunatus endophyticus]
MTAAAHQFASRGYAGTSIAQIAAEMGRPKSAVGYHQFASKEELAFAIIEEQWQRWDQLRQAADALPLPSVTRLLCLLLATGLESRGDPVTLGAVRLLAERDVLGFAVPEQPFVWRNHAVQRIQESLSSRELVSTEPATAIAARLLTASFGMFEAENRGLQPIDTEANLRGLWLDLLTGIDPVNGPNLVARATTDFAAV